MKYVAIHNITGTLQVFILFIIIFLFSCTPLRKNSIHEFTVKESSYQSWIVNENEKGTDIILLCTNVVKEVEFDSIIFRGIMIPVTTKVENGNYIIKGSVRSGLSVLKPENTVINKPDQLIYSYKGNRYSYYLSKIKRKEMKYFRNTK